MWEALGWGALAASSLVIGALLGVSRQWHQWLIGVVLGFGTATLHLHAPALLRPGPVQGIARLLVTLERG